MSDIDLDSRWPVEVVPEADLVGRAALVEAICANILAGRSVSLMAPRRVGKTSVALEALRQLESKGAIVAHIDFFGVDSKRHFAEQLIRQVIENSHSLRERLKQVGRAVRRAAGVVKPFWSMAQTEFGIDLGAENIDEDELFRRALELPETLAQREERLCVVFLDEFQDAARVLGPNVYATMRSHFQLQPHTKHIFAGSHESLLRPLFTRPNAPLLRYAVEVPFVEVPHGDWQTYIVRKFNEARLSCTPALADQIIYATGGHPADTMEVCQQLEFAVRAAQTRQVRLELLHVAVAAAAAVLSHVFDEIWEQVGATSGARLTARRIAAGEPARPAAMHTQTYSRAVQALLDKGVLRRAPGRSHFIFPEPLFKRYVLRQDRSWA